MAYPWNTVTMATLRNIKLAVWVFSIIGAHDNLYLVNALVIIIDYMHVVVILVTKISFVQSRSTYIQIQEGSEQVHCTTS